MTVTTFEVIDTARALELLELAVTARGRDYRYNSEFRDAEYVTYAKADTYDNGDPKEGADRHVACMIAEALRLHGVDVWELEQLSDSMPELAGFYTAGEANRFRYDDTHHYIHEHLLDTGEDDLALLGVQLTEDAARIWWAAQRVQDDNHPWGEALDKAREVAALLAAG
jgi:hypothetical protein